MEAGAIIIYLLGLIIGLLILWYIIKTAVRGALRDHQEWLEQREAKIPTQSSVSDSPRTPAPKGSKLEEIRRNLDES